LTALKFFACAVFRGQHYNVDPEFNFSVEKEIFFQQKVYSDCDIPLVGGESILGNFAISDNGSLTRAGRRRGEIWGWW
jgi:hypothetical protein